MRSEGKAGENKVYYIGYNLAWRITFLVFALYLFSSSVWMLSQSLLGTGDDWLLPTSILVAAIFLALYLMPLILVRQQTIELSDDGLTLHGEVSSVVLPWSSITNVRFKRVMLLMPYLVISTSNMQVLAEFLDGNPRSFLSKWTRHVRVFRRYPFVLRWLFSVPKTMNTLAVLDWLEKRYGGAIVIDVAAANGRGRELHALLSERMLAAVRE